jgi:DNA-binding response OmpR family regulator
MSEGIEQARRKHFLYIGINAANIIYKPHLSILREVTNTPILISTTTYTMQEATEAKKLGADLFGQISDKPEENIDAVMTEIQSINKRGRKRKPPIDLIICGNILITPTYHQVIIGNVKVELTKTEFDLLYCLMNNRGRTLTFHQIYHEIWDGDCDTASNAALHQHIYNIREKISKAAGHSGYIESVAGVGYRFLKHP